MFYSAIPTGKKLQIWVLLGLFIGMTVLGVSANYFKWQALSFHSDFAFYLEFANRMSDGQLSNKLAVNPRGSNWMSWNGTEGEISMHQSLHLEPIKYSYALLYRVWSHPLIIFIFLAAVYFVPILYIGRFFPVRDGIDEIFKWLLVLLYCIYPAVLDAISFDLRSYIWLIPLWLLSFLALQWKRQWLEVVLLFNLMFLAREESLVFGFVLVIYAMVKGSSYRIYVKPLLISWLVWLIGTLVYFNWTGYVLLHSPNTVLKRIGEIILEPTVSMLLIGGVIALIVVGKRFRGIARRYLPLLIFSLVLIPVFLPFGSVYFGGSPISAIHALLYGSRWMLGVVCLLMVLVIWWAELKSKRLRQINLFVIAVLLVVVSAMTIFSEYSLLRVMMQNKDGPASNKWLFELSEQLDKYNDVVLLDSRTFSVFTSFENTFSYERLPWYLVAGEARNYPDNAGVVRKLLREQVEYIVVSSDQLDEMNKLIREAGLIDAVTVIREDDRFTAMRINRD